MKIENFKLKIPVLKYGILTLLEVLLLFYFLFWRYKLGLVRFFDVDEFAHLHWGYSLFIGEKPYSDFFYLFPPFFLYPIATLFLILGRSVTAVIAARIFIFIVFTFTCLIIILIGKKLKNWQVGLLAAFIFSILPLPSDKMIEVRPDLIATFLSLSGTYLFILGQENNKKHYYFFSGLLFFTSLGFVPKTIFFLLPVILIIGYQAVINVRKTLDSAVKPFTFGVFIPGIILLILLMSYGRVPFALFSMTKIANAITATLGHKFFMRPDIFFYPNDVYYGLPGYSQPFVINLIIYVFASLWAVRSFIQSLSYKDRNICIREFAVGCSFFINLYAFVNIYPLKHAQYLIMIAPFIAYYFADLISRVFTGKIGQIGLIIFLFYLAFTGNQMYKAKINWINKPTLTQMNLLLRTIPEKSKVFDLTGESIFFRNGYYFCCIPYGQYEESLLFNLPDIESEFKKRDTQYVYVNWFDRLNVLPNLQKKYILENFKPALPDNSLFVRK